ncbi:hypothetical protein JCM11491_001005 [Sporobolomyces phaffii]
MIALLLALIPISIGFLLVSSRRHLAARQRRRLAGHQSRTVVGFFHPYCNAGGGGERVLWTALAHMQRTRSTNPKELYVVYTGDRGVTKESMIEKVKSRFGITLDPTSLEFVFLKSRYLVEDSTWPRFTLVGQSLGSVLLAIEALWNVVPDVWVDTMGYAFTYPLVKLACRIPVGSYTHYPTISTDMLSRVSTRQAGHSNASIVSRSVVLTHLKLAYYRLFATLYRHALSQADLIWVNSTWTRRHVQHLVPAHRVDLLYPPCDTTSLASLPLGRESRDPFQVLSLSQFRPEKEHSLQLESLAQLFVLRPDLQSRVRLILAGSVRNSGDEQRVAALEALATKLGIKGQVEFKINEDWDVVRELLGTSGVGLHTMFDEHFGITLVEFQAAGLIPLAHASAGPLLDIVVPYSPPSPSTFLSGPTGYLASSAAKGDLPLAFARELEKIFELGEEEQGQVRARARENAVERFGTAVFERGWEEGWKRLVHE